MKKIVAVVAALVLLQFLLVRANAEAVQLPDGHVKVCTLPSGIAVPESLASLGGYAGVTTLQPLLIRYDPQRFNQIYQVSDQIVLNAFHGNPPPGEIQRVRGLVTAFTAFHECAHARVPTGNEVVANCEAIIEMRINGQLSPTDESFLGIFHGALGFMPWQYGGSGAAFWSETQQCLAQRGNQIFAASPDKGFH